MVTLYMDGATYEPYLVTNDWPIHPSHIAMQLTVGACWQGNPNLSPSLWPICVQPMKGIDREKGKANGVGIGQENVLSLTNKIELIKIWIHLDTKLV